MFLHKTTVVQVHLTKIVVWRLDVKMRVMKRISVLLICMPVCWSVVAHQKEDVRSADVGERGMECIVRVTGVSSVEELDPDEVERLLRLLDRPVNLNTASAGRLVSSGLLTSYQIAALTDYRLRHGNVMSFTELAAVDGFNAAMVEALKPFVTLEVRDYEVPMQGRTVRQELAVRTSGKGTSSGAVGSRMDRDFSYGMKYTIEAGPQLTGGIGMNRSYGGETYAPSAYAGNLQWEFLRGEGKVIVGDFNARFGQGLALWSGMLMDNLTSPSAMMRKPSGFTRSSSFTGNTALTGAAAEVGSGRFTLSAAVAYPFLALAGLAWTCRYGKVSVTHVADDGEGGDAASVNMRTAADVAFCLRGVNAYAEAVYAWKEHKPSVLVGTDFPIGERFRTGLQLRCSPQDIHCLAVSSSCNDRESGFTGTLSANAICYPVPKKGDADCSVQVRTQFDGEYAAGDGTVVKARLSGRYRTWGTPVRAEARVDLSHSWGLFTFTSRADLLKCGKFSGLVYAEGEWRFEKMALHARQGVFLVDDWDGRIYVYERDAPGSFNVPAMYGRGVWGSVVMSWKLSRFMKVYLRAAYTSYLLMDEQKRKPGKAELKLQTVFRF